MWQTKCLVGTIEADMATKILIKNAMSTSEWKKKNFINFNEKNIGELKTKKIKSKWSWTWMNLGTHVSINSNRNLANSKGLKQNYNLDESKPQKEKA